jgi:predicted nucleic acid-binding protein
MAVPLVPDASVLLKWVLRSDDEPDADKALQLRAAILDDTVHVIVPPLWVYEVGNTVARRFPAHAQTWLSALLRFGLEEMPASQSWLARSLELTSRHEVSFYDAAYHARPVAGVIGAEFLRHPLPLAARSNPRPHLGNGRLLAGPKIQDGNPRWIGSTFADLLAWGLHFFRAVAHRLLAQFVALLILLDVIVNSQPQAALSWAGVFGARNFAAVDATLLTL